MHLQLWSGLATFHVFRPLKPACFSYRQWKHSFDTFESSLSAKPATGYRTPNKNPPEHLHKAGGVNLAQCTNPHVPNILHAP
jgi:hypothetical protein